MMAGIPARIGIGVELPDYPHIETRLLFRLTHSRRLKAFSVIYKPSGNCPSIWRILPFDQHNTVLPFYYYVNSGERVTRITKHMHLFSVVVFCLLNSQIQDFLGNNSGYGMLVDKLFIRFFKQNDKTVEPFDNSLQPHSVCEINHHRDFLFPQLVQEKILKTLPPANSHAPSYETPGSQ